MRHIHLALLGLLLAAVACGDANAPTALDRSHAATVSAMTEGLVVFSGRFTRSNGPPVEHVVELDVPADVTEATLLLVNGRASSGTVRIGDQIVVRPNDLNPGVGTLSRAVSLGAARPVILRVSLAGSPGSYIDISLSIPVPVGAVLGPEGGTLVLADGAVRIDAPAGAVESDVVITVEPLAADPEQGILGQYRFGPAGTQFLEPLTITLSYPAGANPAGGRPGPRWKDGDGLWLPLANPTFDLVAGTVTGQINHFTDIGALVEEILVCPDGAGATADISSALGAVAHGGRISLCDAEHAVVAQSIDRPVTIGSAGDFRARVLGAAGQTTFLVDEVASGTVVIQDLDFSGFGTAVRAAGSYDEVVIERSDFAGIGTAVSVVASNVAGSRAIVRNSSFIGGSTGVFASQARRVDVIDNDFENQTGLSSLQFQQGTDGVISGNELEGCGWRGCIRVVSAGTVLITGNTVRTSPRLDVFFDEFERGVVFGIVADGEEVVVEYNLVEGLGTVDDPDDLISYPMSEGALAAVEGTTVFRGNVVRNAGLGLGTFGSFFPTHVTVVDNVIEDVHTAIRLRRSPFEESTLAVHQNDFVDYLVAVSQSAGTGLPVPDGSLACNWWGQASGPGVTQGAIDVDAFMPPATAPIAGTGRPC